MTKNLNVLVIGGAGYVGAVLVPKLLENYSVTVFDLMIYGEDVLEPAPGLSVIKGDQRDLKQLEKIMPGHDAVIHLACISNDPSFELNPELGKSINFDPFEDIVKLAKASNVSRFIYASSSSVYGIKDEENVSEELSLEPLTDYSKYKALCEGVLLRHNDENFCATIIRPATVCGYSPRQRLDVVVNILTNHGYHNGKIKVFGGNQKRPNLHIKDMVRAYEFVLESPKEKVSGEIFNVGFENHTVTDLALLVQKKIGKRVEITFEPTDDNRSYHVSSNKISEILNFYPEFTVEDAVVDLLDAFKSRKLSDPLNNSSYFNIRRMKEINLV